jgi:DNA topoisomerase I
MAQNCIIVESPSKAKTIKKYLGDDYHILATVGHIRDLPKKELGIDTANNFEPKYIALPGKNDVITNLKKAVKAADNVYIATDPDREGEAIAWHLTKLLKLDEKEVKRIEFHEITKNAVQEAVSNPQKINLELVNAQQARRVLDRLVGFELSPLLWKKIKPSLSAGRVQSVAVRIIVEREEEIEAFVSESSFKVTAIFILSDGTEVNAELSKRFKKEDDVEKFLRSCMGANFHISEIEKKKASKSAPAPFTTSTLQQEAGRKLRYSVSQTMMLAQKLYEAGHITYMRTDSLNLSNLALGMIKEQIVDMFGDAYSHPRKFKTKAKGAQEAHEAIRPTNMKIVEAGDTKSLKSLYKLIWQRTMASQMTAADIERTNVKIANNKNPELLEAKGEVVTFPGFLVVYKNGDDESKLLPPMKQGENLDMKEMDAIEKFTQPPSRYSEPMLVKKMEELGIGRPSTYAPTISTIQKREYVEKGDRPGIDRAYRQFTLIDNEIKREDKKEKANAVKSKLFPTDIGRVVNKFLVTFFDDIINYNFTAHIEQDFDEIAEGKIEWHAMIKEFYDPFHAKIEETKEKSEVFKGERLLGVDPDTGLNVYVKIGRFGPMVQLGESKSEEKPRFASLLDDQRLDTIDLKSALNLLSFPKTVGTYEDEPMVVAFGRFGPYVKHKSKFYAIPKTESPADVDTEKAIELIEAGRETARKRLIHNFEKEKIQVLNGRYGPYIKYDGKNFKMPKGTDHEKLDAAACLEIIKNTKPSVSKRKTKKK